MLTGPENNINIILFIQYTRVHNMYHKIYFRNRIYPRTTTILKQNCFKTKYIKKRNIKTKSESTSKNHTNKNVFKTETF